MKKITCNISVVVLIILISMVTSSKVQASVKHKNIISENYLTINKNNIKSEVKSKVISNQSSESDSNTIVSQVQTNENVANEEVKQVLDNSTEGNHNGNQDQNIGENQESIEDSEEEDWEDLEEPDEYSVKILRSEEIGKDSITTKDDYINRQFIITIPGDYVDYYEEYAPEEMDSSLKSISIKLNKNGDTTIYLKTKKVRAFDVVENDEAIFVTVKAPKDMYDKIVILDAGHGGGDTGAIGNSLYEKNLTLDIVNYAKEYLDTESDIKVYYTRLTDFEKSITKGKSSKDPIKTTGASLVARYNFANETGADLFISVHINSFPTGRPRGTEVFYAKKNPRTNRMGITSKKLADLCLPNILDAVKSLDRKIKDGSGLAVLKHTTMPAILIETAFISNKSDAAILADESKKDDIGLAIYNTILEAFGDFQ